MRKLLIPIGLFFILLLTAGTIQAEINVGLSADKDGIKSFYLTIGDCYHTNEMEIRAVRNLDIQDEELPLVFFFTSRFGVGKDEIVRMRLKGTSWMDICLHFGHSAELFYVPVKSDPGPPYGKAYGHFKKKNKNQWKEIRLTDAEIINLVNLKFMSQYYGFSPDEIIKMRANGKSFIAINGDVKKIKNKNKNKSLVQKGNNGANKNKGKKKK